jgi:glucose/mannose transport system permease protein
MSEAASPQVSATDVPAIRAVAARRKPLSRDRLMAILMVLPSIVAIAIFVYGFIAWNAWASLTDWKGLAPMKQVGPIKFPDADFVGLENFQKLFADQRFTNDLIHNGIFTVAFLVACVIIGLLLAILLDQRIAGESFFRNVFLFPMALSFVVTGTIWRWVFRDLDWTTNRAHPEWALFAVIIAAVWQMTGFTMAMFLAALRGIPDELREAARVDGASEFAIYRHVIIPLINPIILSALIILGHISLKIFDLIYVMTHGSPTLGYATDMPATYMFEITFSSDLFARGAAVAVIILLLVAVVIVPYLWTSRRSEASS